MGEQSSNLFEFKSSWQNVQKKVKEAPESYRKLARRAMVCAVLALGIWGVKSLDTAVSKPDHRRSPERHRQRSGKEEDLGKLKFVNGEEQGAAIGVSGSIYSLPLEGEVVESFSDSGKDVSIKGESSARVNAILSGVVVKTTSDSVIVENENGTKSTYTVSFPAFRQGIL